MHPPLPLISFQTNTAFKRTVMFNSRSGYLLSFEKTAIDGRALEGRFLFLPRNHKEASMDIDSPQTVKKAKLCDVYLAHINKL